MVEPNYLHKQEQMQKKQQLKSTALPLLMNHVCVCAGNLLNYEFFKSFFLDFDVDDDGRPLKNPDCKASRYAHVFTVGKVCDNLEDVVVKVLKEADVRLPRPLQSIDVKTFAICWAVRWLVRRPASPMRDLLLNPANWQTEAGTKEEIEEVTRKEFGEDSTTKQRKPKAKKRPKLFGDDFMEAYLACLKADWSLTDAEVAAFKEAMDYMLQKATNCMDALIDGRGIKPDWPEKLTQGFIDSHKDMGSRASLADVMADILAMLFIAALYGSSDYRWEFSYLKMSLGQFLKTEGAANGFQRTATRNGVLNTYPILTRVTYDTDSGDELDFVICSDPIHFKGIAKVRFGRAVRDTVVHEDTGDIAYIRLTDWRIDDSYLACVSKAHAYITKDKDGAWVLCDWQSANGTLVISRSSERYVVGGTNNPRRSQALHNGDVICFGHSLENGLLRADALLPCYVFNRGIDYRDMPDLRSRRHGS